MQQHMGYLVKRVFLNKDIDNDHFIDICVTRRNDCLLWYCEKDKYHLMYGICLDEKMQDVFFYEIDAKYDDEDFEEKLQMYFKDYTEKDYRKVMLSFYDGKENIGVIPNRIKFDRESDTHVLMTEDRGLCQGISKDFLEEYLFGMIMNSVEEFMLGQATSIKVRVKSDAYEIIDDGSGIPVEDNEKFRDYEWRRILLYPKLRFDYPEIFGSEYDDSEFVYCMSSEYDRAGTYKQCPKYYYKGSVPKSDWFPGDTLAKAKSFSKFMKVTTIRNGKEFSFEFKNGYCTSGRVINEISDMRRGTHIIWSPDECCFDSVAVSSESLADFLQRQAFLNAGLHITLDYEGSIHAFNYPGGIEEYLCSEAGKMVLPVRKRKVKISTEDNEKKSGQEELEICLAMGQKGFLESYHNYRKMHYGSTIDDVYSEITDWLNKYLKSSGLYLKYPKYEDVELTVEEVKRHFGIVLSSYSEYSSFTNGAQEGLSNLYFELAVKKSISSILMSYFRGISDKDRIELTKKVIDEILS